MAVTIPAETKELAKALYIQGLRFPQISSHTGVAPNVLRSWCHRYRWKAIATKALQLPQQTLKRGLAVETANTLQAMGDKIRDQLSQEIAQQVRLLAENPATTTAELASSRLGQGRAQVVKTIVESAAMVHDWANQNQPGLVLVAELAREEEPPAALDIPATVSPAPEQQGAETTTGSEAPAPQSLSEDNPLPL